VPGWQTAGRSTGRVVEGLAVGEVERRRRRTLTTLSSSLRRTSCRVTVVVRLNTQHMTTASSDTVTGRGPVILSSLAVAFWVTVNKRSVRLASAA